MNLVGWLGGGSAPVVVGYITERSSPEPRDFARSGCVCDRRRTSADRSPDGL